MGRFFIATAVFGAIGFFRDFWLVFTFGRSGPFIFRFGGLFLAFTAIVGFVKAAALEDDPGAAADQSPNLHPRTVGAFADRGRGNRLELLKSVATVATKIFISRHGKPQKKCGSKPHTA